MEGGAWPSPKWSDNAIEKLVWRLEGAEVRLTAKGLLGVKSQWKLLVGQNANIDVTGTEAHCSRCFPSTVAAVAAAAAVAAFLCTCGVLVEPGFLGADNEPEPSL